MGTKQFTAVTPSPPAGDLPELLPVRMLNEYAYCPRLAYLEWVQSEFADNEFTEEGRYAHRRVDRETPQAPPEPDRESPVVSRSVLLSAEREGLVARIDLLETEGDEAVPVDYKRGKQPDVPEGAYEPERVQVCAQGLILRENGFRCDHGTLYFAGSRRRVTIPFDRSLVDRTRALAAQFRAAAAAGVIPEPLEDSPKCVGCSLVGICLPDETSLLQDREPLEGGKVRRLIPARDDALPLYVQEQGAYVGKKGQVLEIKLKGEKLADSRLFDTSQVCLMGNVQISTQALRELCVRGTSVVFLSSGGWFYGMTNAGLQKNIELRRHQFRAAEDPEWVLNLSRRFVRAKILNCRTMLRRNAADLEPFVLKRLRRLASDAERAPSVESLLGIEGTAARLYFGSFSKMLKKSSMDSFSFERRNRRPPRDPVNALLSLAYALLVKDFTLPLLAAGLDPYLGFFHQPRYGRPSLALDLMEEFRPLIADSTVIAAINTSVVGPDDFERSGLGVALKTNARRDFILAYERRMNQEVRHPVFGYKISYRRVLDVQSRLLGRFLAGEIEEFPSFTTR
ncbi:MAG: CRISPR-associated endonuclease Cas1 [Acidobacteriota bacterium]